MRTTIRYSRIARGMCCALAVSALTGHAVADWESTPDIRMEIEANDNPRLGQEPGALRSEDLEDHTATRMLMDARVRLRNVGPRGEVTLQPRVRADAYSDDADDDLERQDVYLNSRASYDWRRATAGLNL